MTVLALATYGSATWVLRLRGAPRRFAQDDIKGTRLRVGARNDNRGGCAAAEQRFHRANAVSDSGLRLRGKPAMTEVFGRFYDNMVG